jgi:hypothetical protein
VKIIIKPYHLYPDSPLGLLVASFEAHDFLSPLKTWCLLHRLKRK